MVRPTLLYASETWNCCSNQIKTLESFEYRCLRTILGKKWSDKISYEEILNSPNFEEISTIKMWIRNSRLKKLAEIINMNDDRLLKMIAHGEPAQGKRKIGRPRKSWREFVTEDLRIFHLDIPTQHPTGKS